MAYYYEKETYNPFLSLLVEKWDELIEFDGDTLIEKIIRSCSTFIVVICIIFLIPIGTIISIYNSLYNLQKKAYGRMNCYGDSSYSQFVTSVEYGIYLLLSLPFFIILLPFWIISALFIWLTKHRIIAFIILLIIIIYLLFVDVINYYIAEIIY